MEIFFFGFWQPLKNVKTILSSWTTQKEALVWQPWFTIYKALSFPLFHLIHHPRRKMLWFPFLSWGNWRPEKETKNWATGRGCLEEEKGKERRGGRNSDAKPSEWQGVGSKPLSSHLLVRWLGTWVSEQILRTQYIFSFWPPLGRDGGGRGR